MTQHTPPAPHPLLSKSLPAPPGEPEKKLVICLVSAGKLDASLTLAVSLLNLQTKLVRTSVQTQLHVVDTFSDAMNIAHGCGADLLSVETNIGFDPDFVIKAMESPHDIVSAVYPLPGIDWDRIKSAAAGTGEPGEPVNCRGNTYSAVPVPLASSPVNGYVRAAAPRLGCVFVRAGVAADILSRNPGIKHDKGGAFAGTGIVDGKLRAAHETFAALWAKHMWIDVDRPATTAGPMSFAGSVGMRQVLR